MLNYKSFYIKLLINNGGNMTKDYVMKPEDYKLPPGYDINVDHEYKLMLQKYPTFDSIKVGNIIFSDNLKARLADEIEDQKTALWYYWQAQRSLSYFDTMIKLMSEPEYNYKNEPVDEYTTGKKRLLKDMESYKMDYAKSKVWYELIKLKMYERK